mgnify:CR=1 FL=1
MNNRYIFRGKRKDNGELIYGDLIIDQYGKYYIHPNANAFSVNEYNLAKCIQMIEVIPETVEQCSGVPDRNGKLMYTGDIINALFDFGMPIKSVCGFKNGSFGLLAKQHGAEHFHAFISLWNVKYEVIGNIYDNPELLEVER